MEHVNIRDMSEGDLEEVMRIEHASFSVPWTRKSFEQELNENKYASYFIIEDEQGVFGYCGLWMIIDEAHITNIALLPEYRGGGYGARLFEHTVEKAKEAGAILLSLEVRVSNLQAQHMYRKFGLVPGGIRKNYYTDNGEDALVMWVNFYENK
ncbi:ribosomal protein S18-alanine N-acetyltransferase [Thalassobacillus pellis]|uniref:ribosomal protein S18-alanine N-acetyltransferase n=1 Tax=Thalassobacillus pellis TaxID=748008 RepID=UPI001EF806D8|nr:ribosomal protein S18-alanine N-acetyltransferase [Thalassobacillus pellis]MBM7553249.1 ribosomal-protein-alanine N-acetyltransferase [Thalassobacillus pellis]